MPPYCPGKVQGHSFSSGGQLSCLSQVNGRASPLGPLHLTADAWGWLTWAPFQGQPALLCCPGEVRNPLTCFRGPKGTSFPDCLRWQKGEVGEGTIPTQSSRGVARSPALSCSCPLVWLTCAPSTRVSSTEPIGGLLLLFSFICSMCTLTPGTSVRQAVGVMHGIG